MGIRILVIDDDRKITDLLRRGLGYEGYMVDIANNGIEGLAQALEPFCIAFIQLISPGWDAGFSNDAVRKLSRPGDGEL